MLLACQTGESGSADLRGTVPSLHEITGQDQELERGRLWTGQGPVDAGTPGTPDVPDRVSQRVNLQVDIGSLTAAVSPARKASPIHRHFGVGGTVDGIKSAPQRPALLA